jgi:hypothetical protein
MIKIHVSFDFVWFHRILLQIREFVFCGHECILAINLNTLEILKLRIVAAFFLIVCIGACVSTYLLFAAITQCHATLMRQSVNIYAACAA